MEVIFAQIPRSPRGFKNAEGTPPCPRAVGPSVCWSARGQDKRTEIRKRKGNEIEKESKKRKQRNAISSQISRNQYASRKSLISQGSSRVGVFSTDVLPVCMHTQKD